jgi:hypothetical protein
MISIIFSKNPILNKKINRIIGIMTIIGFIGAGCLWTWNLVEPQIEKIATEIEAKQFDKESMDAHNAFINTQPYAMKNDVAHIANLMVDEQIGDARAEIRQIEDVAALDDRKLTVAEELQKARLTEDIIRYRRSYLDEPGELHSHDR